MMDSNFEGRVIYAKTSAAVRIAVPLPASPSGAPHLVESPTRKADRQRTAASHHEPPQNLIADLMARDCLFA
jgi:hypothetical protein